MARMALMAPKRAQEQRNALSGLFTWYAPFLVLPRQKVTIALQNPQFEATESLTNPMYNRLLSPLTLPVKVTRDKDGRPRFDSAALQTAIALVDLRKISRRQTSELITASEEQAAKNLELYLRRMLSRCAVRIHLPYNSGNDMPQPQQLKRLLAPTLRKTIRFVDRSDSYWDAVISYLKPISRSLLNDQRVSTLAWRLYLLILATKYNSEVVPPKPILNLIREIESSDGLDAEARARLSLVAGLFASFSKTIEGNTIRLLPNAPSLAVSERIAEILEDAYLLEASYLRRLLGVKENIASVKRDLRKLLSFIQRKRPWAKGLITIGSDVVVGGASSMALLEKLVEVIPDIGSGAQSAVLALRDEGIMIENESCFQFARSIPGDTLISLDPHVHYLSESAESM